ncbi:MAG: hypothetical protein ACWGOX_05910, partial [Desulforhopalus sp.]
IFLLSFEFEKECFLFSTWSHLIGLIAVRDLAARQDDMYAHSLLTEALTDPDHDVQILASQLVGRQ